MIFAYEFTITIWHCCACGDGPYGADHVLANFTSTCIDRIRFIDGLHEMHYRALLAMCAFEFRGMDLTKQTRRRAAPLPSKLRRFSPAHLETHYKLRSMITPQLAQCGNISYDCDTKISACRSCREVSASWRRCARFCVQIACMALHATAGLNLALPTRPKCLPQIRHLVEQGLGGVAGEQISLQVIVRI
jgi:hypothetical protein